MLYPTELWGQNVVGLTGFEPATSPPRTARATKLRYSPWVQAKDFPLSNDLGSWYPPSPAMD